VDIACKCIASLSQYGHFLGTSYHWTNFVFDWGAAAKKEGLQILEKATMEGRHALLEHEAKRLLGLHGAPVSNDRLARTAKEAVAMAAQLGAPVALKICSPDILHKSAANGVKLRLQTEIQVRSAFAEIMDHAKR
jgi:acetyltransferase